MLQLPLRVDKKTEKCSADYLTEIKSISKLVFDLMIYQQPLIKTKSKILKSAKQS